MKKFVPKLIPFGILFVLAGLDILRNYSVERLIIEAAILVVLALGIFVGKSRNMIHDIPWFVAGGLLFGVFIPRIFLSVEMVNYGLAMMVEAVENPYDSEVFLIGVVAFAILQLLFRKKTNLVLIILRHIAMFLFLLGLQEAMMGPAPLHSRVALVLVLLSLLYELKTKAFGAHERKSLCCVLCCVGYIVIMYVFGLNDMFGSTALLSSEGMLRKITISTAILGVLMVLEEYNNRVNLRIAATAFDDLGLVLLFWSLLSFVMQLWPAVMNWIALLPAPIIAYYCYGLFARQWKEHVGGNQRMLLLVTWSLCVVGFLLLGKYLNTASYVSWLLIALLVAASVCWRVSVKGNNALIMSCYCGLAAIVLLFASVVPVLPSDIQLIKLVLGIAAMTIFWFVLCKNAVELEKCVSDIYSEEFKYVIILQRKIPLIMLAFAVIILLFA